MKKGPDGHDKHQLEWVARLDTDFLHDTLTLTMLVAAYGETFQDGAYQRLSVEYDISDALNVDGGIVWYQSGNLTEFSGVGDCDRIFFEIKYSF